MPIASVAAGRRRLVAVLAITQTIGYGGLHYTFPVLLRPIAAGLHASAAAVTGAFTTAILAWAAVAMPVGRLLDRRGGRPVLVAGSLLGARFSQAASGSAAPSPVIVAAPSPVIVAAPSPVIAAAPSPVIAPAPSPVILMSRGTV